MVAIIAAAFATAAAVCNGSFAVLARLTSVQDAQVPSHIFSFWTNVGVCLSCLMMVPKHSGFTQFGLISGLCTAASTASIFAAIDRLGLAVSYTIWLATCSLTYFFFGAFMLQYVIQPGLSTCGVILLLLGITGAALSSSTDKAPTGKEIEFTEFTAVRTDDHDDDSETVPMRQGLSSSQSLRESGATTKADPHTIPRLGLPPEKISGVISALVAGLFGGLIFAPMDYAPTDMKYLAYLPSMAAGVALFMVPLTVVLHHRATGRLPWFPELKEVTVAAILPGLISGATLNLGTVLSLLALQDPVHSPRSAPPTIVKPIMQCAVLVASMWGTLRYKELTKPAQIILWPSAIVVIFGAALLAMAR